MLGELSIKDQIWIDVARKQTKNWETILLDIRQCVLSNLPFSSKGEKTRFINNLPTMEKLNKELPVAATVGYMKSSSQK